LAQAPKPPIVPHIICKFAHKIQQVSAAADVMMRQMLLLRTHGERETMMRYVDDGFSNVVDQCGHVRHAKMRHAEKTKTRNKMKKTKCTGERRNRMQKQKNGEEGQRYTKNGERQKCRCRQNGTRTKTVQQQLDANAPEIHLGVAQVTSQLLANILRIFLPHL